MLRVEGVSKRFMPQNGPVDALRDVSLTVEEGDFTAVLGASGSGKTTLLRVIAGFERPDSGTVELNGRILTGPSTLVPPERRNVGIVAQDGALFPHLSVADNIAYGLRCRRARVPWRRRTDTEATRVEELLELVGLGGYGSRSPKELSGGQQQRVALARALAPNPGLLLMDEPFSALDTGLRTMVREEVRDLLRQLNTTVVLVTHDQNEALSMADHVVIMRDGQVVQSGTPSELYRNPVDRRTAEFLGTAVVLPATMVEGLRADGNRRARCVLGEVPVARVGNDREPVGSTDGAVVFTDPSALELDNCPLCAVIRPEQLVFDDAGAPGTVSSVNFYGHDGTAKVVLDDSATELVVRVSGTELPEPGQRVAVSLSPGAEVLVI